MEKENTKRTEERTTTRRPDTVDPEKVGAGDGGKATPGEGKPNSEGGPGSGQGEGPSSSDR